jgi:hypothetical protein
VGHREFIPYHEVYEYTRGIDEVVAEIRALANEGHGAAAVELTEYALERVEAVLGNVDDSDGYVGGVRDQLKELHLAACKQARPDPEALARCLFAWELRTPWDTFAGAVARYAGVLGQRGLATYRKLAEAEWARVPARKPGDGSPDDFSQRYRITSIMEALAEQSGEVEALVAVKQRDLSSPYAYLAIAEIYRQAKKHDLALEWAERGREAFPGQRGDERLSDFLAEEYHRRKRHDDAMAEIWAQFGRQPCLAGYEKLKRHAGRIGQWPAWRERALDTLRRSIAQRKAAAAKDTWPWAPRVDHSELVRVFLWEKDVEAAWAEAKAGGLRGGLVARSRGEARGESSRRRPRGVPGASRADRGPEEQRRLSRSNRPDPKGAPSHDPGRSRRGVRRLPDYAPDGAQAEAELHETARPRPVVAVTRAWKRPDISARRPLTTRL